MKPTSLATLSKLFLVIAAFGLLPSGCTDDEQAKMMERQRQIDARDNTRDTSSATPTPTSEEQAPASTQEESSAGGQMSSQPEEQSQPAEPETKTITVYKFTSNTETRAVECTGQPGVQNCGITFENCTGGMDYYCQQGVRTWTEEKTVTK